MKKVKKRRKAVTDQSFRVVREKICDESSNKNKAKAGINVFHLEMMLPRICNVQNRAQSRSLSFIKFSTIGCRITPHLFFNFYKVKISNGTKKLTNCRSTFQSTFSLVPRSLVFSPSALSAGLYKDMIKGTLWFTLFVVEIENDSLFIVEVLHSGPFVEEGQGIFVPLGTSPRFTQVNHIDFRHLKECCEKDFCAESR